MKQLKSVENDQVQLEVIECDCGFHLGIDATWLEQSSNAEGFELNCPACNKIIPVDKLTNPDELVKSINNELDLIEFGINEVRSGTNSIENFTYLILPKLINNIKTILNS